MNGFYQLVSETLVWVIKIFQTLAMHLFDSSEIFDRWFDIYVLWAIPVACLIIFALAKMVKKLLK